MIDVLGNLHNQMKLMSTLAQQGEVHGTTFNNDAQVSLFCYCLLHVHVPLMLIWLIKPFVEMK